MRRQRAAYFCTADEAVEDTVREARLGAEGRSEEGREWVELRSLNDDGVTACQGGCDLLSQARDGRVERDNAGSYAPWLA